MTQLEKILDVHSILVNKLHEGMQQPMGSVDLDRLLSLVRSIDLLAKQAACLDGDDNLTQQLGLGDD